MTLFNFTASLVSGLISSMGLGGGGILIIYLTAAAGLPQIFSQGINLTAFVPSAVIATAVYQKKGLIKINKIKYLYILLIPGALAGYYLLTITDSRISGIIFGAFLIISGVKELFNTKKP